MQNRNDSFLHRHFEDIAATSRTEAKRSISVITNDSEAIDF